VKHTLRRVCMPRLTAGARPAALPNPSNHAHKLNDMTYLPNKTKLADVYCDVLIGIGPSTRINALSSTLYERVMQCVNSHIDAHYKGSKSVEAHSEFVQLSQVFCSEQK
jgi:hypothetical protein